MTNLPEFFEPCKLEVKEGSFGLLGTIVGRLFHYPCWIGMLDPTPSIEAWQEEVLSKLEYHDLDIQLQDLVSGETWTGMMSDLSLPTPDYPWYELKWYDDRRISNAPSQRLWRWLRHCWAWLKGGTGGWRAARA